MYAWFSYRIIDGNLRGISVLELALAFVQIAGIALIVWGVVRLVRHRERLLFKPSLDVPTLHHFAVATLCIAASVTWFILHPVWTSTKLDFVGLEVPGQTGLIRDNQCEYRFTTRDGQVVVGRKDFGPVGYHFLYLRDDPHIFKVKGSGRGGQFATVLFMAIGAWQITAGVKSLMRRKVSANV